MQIDRRLITNFNWFFLFIVFFITIIGIMTIYSANYDPTKLSDSSYIFAKKQVMWWGISIAVMVFFILFDYTKLKGITKYIYFANIFLLVLVLFIGKKSMGAQRWLSIGGFSFQPSELFKISLILYLADYFSEENELKSYTLFELGKLLLFIIIPILIIIKQPDLGTGMLNLFVAATIIIFVGIKRSTLIKVAIFSSIVGPLGWFFLKEYQKKRILTFIFPERDPLGAGYHIIQSKIAIGSGKFLGKGYLHGTQNKLHFLPEEHTDFIFSVFAEEWGFVGSVFLILLYFIFLVTAINIARKAKDTFGTLIVIGGVTIFLWQIFINIGMVIGILPVVGIPLPLMSYGGTSLVISYAIVGLILNVGMRRFLF